MVLHVTIMDDPSSIENDTGTTAKEEEEEVTVAAISNNKSASNAPPRFDDDSESPADYTKRALAIFLEDSKLQHRSSPPVPTVTLDDLIVGPQLGEGGFCIVSAVELVPKDNNKDNSDDGSISGALAMKSLRPEIIQGPMRTFKVAAADLWKEVEFLSALDHPGIVSLRAKHFTYESLDENYIILERIQMTLDDKMQEWREADHVVRNSPEVRLKLLKERLRVCQEICEVFKYLHSQEVIYRDLKSANVGFDHEGKLKLFGKFNFQRASR